MLDKFEIGCRVESIRKKNYLYCDYDELIMDDCIDCFKCDREVSRICNLSGNGFNMHDIILR